MRVLINLMIDAPFYGIYKNIYIISMNGKVLPRNVDRLWFTKNFAEKRRKVIFGDERSSSVKNSVYS